MNKIIWILPIAVAFVVGISASQVTNAEPAIVGKFEDSCGVFTGDGELVVLPQCSWTTITTNSNNDGFFGIIHYETTPSSTGKAVKHTFESTGLVCFGDDANGNPRITTNWIVIVSATGKATVMCKFMN